METVLVLAVLLAVVLLACRSIFRARKRGGCSGNCAGCSSCSGHRPAAKSFK